MDLQNVRALRERPIQSVFVPARVTKQGLLLLDRIRQPLRPLLTTGSGLHGGFIRLAAEMHQPSYQSQRSKVEIGLQHVPPAQIRKVVEGG